MSLGMAMTEAGRTHDSFGLLFRWHDVDQDLYLFCTLYKLANQVDLVFCQRTKSADEPVASGDQEGSGGGDLLSNSSGDNVCTFSRSFFVSAGG